MEPRPPVPSPPPPLPLGALVFAGCGEQAVALAKSFWNSVTLQPPLESCLAPRRASVAGGGSCSAIAKRDSAAAALAWPRRSHFDVREAAAQRGPFLEKSGLTPQASATSRKGKTEHQEDPETESVDGQKALYLQKAKRREEILALLRKQREERIRKEAVSRPHKPKAKLEGSKLKVPESNMEDQESVKALI